IRRCSRHAQTCFALLRSTVFGSIWTCGVCLTCLTCLTKPGQACVWFGTCLLPWAVWSTTLVFGTRPRSPLFVPRHALSQSHCLPSVSSYASPATDVRVPSSFSNKCPLPILAKDRNIDVIAAPRFSLSPAAPPRVSTFTCLPPTIISILSALVLSLSPSPLNVTFFS
ncbi:hypothetical protein C8Q70DRAFT_961767, partial [Cubamyces menziesii]